MIPEFGHFALVLALFVALMQVIFPMVGASRGNLVWMNSARHASIAQFLLISCAFFSLMWCYVTSDFSVLNVAENSHSDKPLLYKIVGVWGNHEGSMLLWVLILALYGLVVSVMDTDLPPKLRARALSVQAMITFAFLLFILLTSNPFARLSPTPINGEGLNPLLQDPGLAFHPPLLYLGYVGFSMAFSFAIAALIEGKVDAAWARYVRPWILMAWSFLGIGIGAGSWWAYYTLGWGGWWYWDPVENASFMPWLVGTALLHSSIVLERRDTLKSWTVLLTIIAFSFSLLGTFLVRSGVLTSVHSFAADPSRGVFILLMLVMMIGGALVLYAVRAPRLQDGGMFHPNSRETALLLNNVTLSVAAAAILLGTLYPLFMDVLNLGKISVGPPYFNAIFVPLMIPTLIVMAVAPSLAWRRADLFGALKKMQIVLLMAILAFVAVWAYAGSLGGAASLALATWVLAATLKQVVERLHSVGWRIAAIPGSFYGMAMAHVGIALILIGITGSVCWKVEKIQTMHIGEHVVVAGYDLKLEDVNDGIKGPNYISERAHILVFKNGRWFADLFPERRLYEMPPRMTTNAAIRTSPLGDVYAVLGEQDEKGAYITRFYFNPLVPWIFIGSGIVAFGGFMSFLGRLYRMGITRKLRREKA